MKFVTAKSKLIEMADGKYSSMSYEVTNYSTGRTGVECKVYIEGHTHYTGESWQEALGKLQKAVDGEPETISPKEEAPE